MKQLIVTCLPSFYKNIAFRKIAEQSELKVFFTYDSKIKRTGDFFRYGLEKKNIVTSRNVLLNLKNLYLESRKADFTILGGWDDFHFWFLRLVVPKRKLKLIVESTIYEFRESKLATPLKRFFVRGISECIVSGQPHSRLVEHLGFKGNIKVSKGVGILDFDYLPRSKSTPSKILNFLYVGRVSKDKGLDLLFDFFLTNEHLNLNIVGTIEDDKYYSLIDNMKNVNFLGYKNRLELKDVYSVNDVFILASKMETWGLVIEEALYHGLPVVVSDKVGCNEDLVNAYNVGQVFIMDDLIDLNRKIERITDINQYNIHTTNINAIDFNAISNNYINCFL
ncbi:glycosyltransferase family 4 protein [Flavobacterium anhuiense]|uniref:glycosyltransferase family 4 protein n=1 Tax=Flavobacterium anhuiense TaxID=459526 RepID=UPI003D977C73